jgi:hypothetical protein
VTVATWAEAQQVDKSNSRVGEHLSEKTTRRVVVIVLAMLFGLPAISISVSSTSQQDGLDYLTYLADHNATRTVFDDAFERYRFFPSVNQWELVSIHVQRAPHSLHNVSLDAEYQPLDNFRDLEIKFVLSKNAAGLYNVAAFNVRNHVRLEGAYSALTTLIVVVLLAIGTSLFGSDADEIVISPIQRMIDVIENMKKNPLAKMTTGDDAELLARMKRAKAGLGSGASTWGDWARDKAEAAWALVSGGGGGSADDDAETGLLEKTLQKLSGLLQVGFGEAGASIIQRNLGSGELNVMVLFVKSWRFFNCVELCNIGMHKLLLCSSCFLVSISFFGLNRVRICGIFQPS